MTDPTHAETQRALDVALYALTLSAKDAAPRMLSIAAEHLSAATPAPSPSPVPEAGERQASDGSEDATWSCKIGPASRGDLPPGSDAPMRAAVEAAFLRLTGHDPEWTFSGWAHDLDEAERAVVENRLPRPRVIAAVARQRMEQAEGAIGTELDPDGTLTTPLPVDRPDTAKLREMEHRAGWEVWEKRRIEAADWIDAQPDLSDLRAIGQRFYDAETPDLALDVATELVGRLLATEGGE